jgi:hypothetical protein
MDGHVGLSVSEDDAINCVPDSLFTFCPALWNRFTNCLDLVIWCNVQDRPICFGVHFLPSLTPYTMSWQTLRILVCFVLNLFHRAGHTLNYHDVLKIDTGLAEKSLESLDVNTGCFVPHNLKFTHFTARLSPQ